MNDLFGLRSPYLVAVRRSKVSLPKRISMTLETLKASRRVSVFENDFQRTAISSNGCCFFILFHSFCCRFDFHFRQNTISGEMVSVADDKFGPFATIFDGKFSRERQKNEEWHSGESRDGEITV